ncbi:MAG TPA: hypothetical protein DHU93_08995, partial [Algoriphagus sp.]|nr:hypothetical protein [Algoriphagus sp.]
MRRIYSFRFPTRLSRRFICKVWWGRIFCAARVSIYPNQWGIHFQIKSTGSG